MNTSKYITVFGLLIHHLTLHRHTRMILSYNLFHPCVACRADTQSLTLVCGRDFMLVFIESVQFFVKAYLERHVLEQQRKLVHTWRHIHIHLSRSM